MTAAASNSDDHAEGRHHRRLRWPGASHPGRRRAGLSRRPDHPCRPEPCRARRRPAGRSRDRYARQARDPRANQLSCPCQRQRGPSAAGRWRAARFHALGLSQLYPEQGAGRAIDDRRGRSRRLDPLRHRLADPPWRDHRGRIQRRGRARPGDRAARPARWGSGSISAPAVRGGSHYFDGDGGCAGLGRGRWPGGAGARRRRDRAVRRQP